MGRKIKVKKSRNREAYLTARTIGGAVMYDTSHGKVLLNVMKHFCYQKPYNNMEYESIMFREIKRRKDAFEKAREAK